MNSFIGQKYLEKIADEKIAECSRFPTGTIQDILAARAREAAKNAVRGKDTRIRNTGDRFGMVFDDTKSSIQPVAPTANIYSPPKPT